MEKYICNDCSQPCEIIAADGSDVPNRCPFRVDWINANWHKVDKEQTVTDCNQLPKLTDDVFYRPDCPLWAVYAAVDKYGSAFFFEIKPSLNTATEKPCIWFSGKAGRIKQISGKWDASNWQHSLIEIKPLTFCIRKSTLHALESAANELQAKIKERPAKKSELPDWCKVGEWVYYRGYRKIIEVKALKLVLESTHCGNLTVYPEEIGKEVKQARLRPWNFEEAPYHLKVKEKNWSRASEELAFLSGRSGKWGYLVGAKDSECLAFYSLEEMKIRYRTLDGEPCGVLEHLENGEWVE